MDKDEGATTASNVNSVNIQKERWGRKRCWRALSRGECGAPADPRSALGLCLIHAEALRHEGELLGFFTKEDTE